MAKPDWGEALHDLLVPQLSSSPVYWLAVVGTVGTTITPWGQAFIQSYTVDKRLRPEDLPSSRLDVFAGALLTNVIAAFILIACAATLYQSGTTITDAAGAAVALEPLAGQAATVLFAVGLLGASFLGLGVVPLTSAYSTCEAFGWETGVDWNWREAPAFYGLLIFFIGFAALFVMIPGLPLIQVMFLAQVVNALLLPFILVFVHGHRPRPDAAGSAGQRARAPGGGHRGHVRAHRDVGDPRRDGRVGLKAGPSWLSLVLWRRCGTSSPPLRGSVDARLRLVREPSHRRHRLLPPPRRL